MLAGRLANLAYFRSNSRARQRALLQRTALSVARIEVQSAPSTGRSPPAVTQPTGAFPRTANWRNSVSDLIAHITDATFESEVLQSSDPVLVDYWAEWCGPCKMIAPILTEIAAEQKDNLIIAKLNVDDHGDIAQRFGVMSIPTLLVFDKGEMKKRMVGAKGKGALLQELSEFLTPSR
jgi:thioredoxin 1